MTWLAPQRFEGSQFLMFPRSIGADKALMWLWDLHVAEAWSSGGEPASIRVSQVHRFTRYIASMHVCIRLYFVYRVKFFLYKIYEWMNLFMSHPWDCGPLLAQETCAQYIAYSTCSITSITTLWCLWFYPWTSPSSNWCGELTVSFPYGEMGTIFILEVHNSLTSFQLFYT